MRPTEEGGGSSRPSPTRSPKPPEESNPWSDLYSSAPPAAEPASPAAPSFDRVKLQKLTPLALSPNSLLEKTIPIPGQSTTVSTMGQTVSIPSPSPGDMANPAYVKQQRQAENAETRPAKKSYEMSWQDYNELTDTQRAAINFNTMLVEAREKDLNKKYEAPSETDQASYDTALKRMFGEDGGSDYFAPETLAVLNQIDFQAPESGNGSDLDDFLGLKVAIKERDLVGLEPDMMALPGAEAVPLKTQLATGTASLEQSLAEGNKLLQNWRATSTLSTGMAADWLGGTDNDVKVPVGYGTGGPHDVMQRGLELLSRPDFDDRDGLLKSMNTALSGFGLDANDFLRFADTKAKQAIEFGVPLIEADEGAKLKSPEEFRALLLGRETPTREGEK